MLLTRGPVSSSSKLIKPEEGVLETYNLLLVRSTGDSMDLELTSQVEGKGREAQCCRTEHLTCRI